MRNNRFLSEACGPAADIGTVRAALGAAQAKTPTAQASLLAARLRGRGEAAARLLGDDVPGARRGRLPGSFHPAGEE